MIKTFKLGMISDTHGHFEPSLLGNIDFLLHAGDLCQDTGNEAEFVTAVNWLTQVNARYKIVIAGNHDNFLHDHAPEAQQRLQDAGIIYLRDRLVEIEGIKIYGSPWTEAQFGFLFELERRDLECTFEKIPDDTDILITHAPPLGILDSIGFNYHEGSESLLTRVAIVKPLLHLFGHMHQSYGSCKISNIWYVNGAIGVSPPQERVPFFATIMGEPGQWQIHGLD